MTRILLTLAALVLSTSSLFAQAITSTTLAITNTTTGIVTTSTLTPANILCGQGKPALTTPTSNPRRVVWDDPGNGALACIWTDPGTGALVALPFGPASYTAVLRFVSSAGTSAPSGASNSFTQPGAVPGAPTGVLVLN
jgi:hypothetical protein